VVVDGRDPDGGPVDFVWDLDGDGRFDDGAGEEVEVVFPDDGEYPISVQATDDEDDESVTEATVRVLNLPPSIDSEAPVQAHEGRLWRYLVEASDPAGLRDPLAIELTERPLGLEAEGFELTWTPTPAQALEGRFLVVIVVRDDDGGSDRQSFHVDVAWSDADGDGMSDGWEEEFGLDPDDPGDADEDPDGDGLSNLEEFLARTDPTRAGRPDPPQPWSPEDGGWSETATPELTVENAFDPDNDPLTYTFRLGTDPELRRVLHERDGIAETDQRTAWRVRPALQEGHLYYWQARASDGVFDSEWSAPVSFTVNAVPEPPRVPRLRAPEEGALVGNLTPSLQTDAVHDPDGDPVSLRFEVYADEGLAELARSGLVEQPEAAALVSWTVDPPLEEDRAYFWRAVAVDLSGLASDWSEVWAFRVNADNAAPPTPELLRPSDGSSLVERTAVLAVRAVPDQDGDPLTFTLELDTTAGFDSPALQRFEDLEVGMGDVVTVEVSGLSDNSRYHWRAAAFDGLLASEWAVRTFVINEENEAPEAPRPLRPSDAATVDPGFVELVVAAAREPDFDPLTYEFELALDPELAEPLAASDPIPGVAPEVSWTGPELEPGGIFYWRCRATDPLRLRSPWSAVASFRTGWGGGGTEGEGEGEGAAEGEGEGEGAAEGEGEGEGEGGVDPIGGGGGGGSGVRRTAQCSCEVGAAGEPGAAAWWLLLLVAFAGRRRAA